MTLRFFILCQAKKSAPSRASTGARSPGSLLHLSLPSPAVTACLRSATYQSDRTPGPPRTVLSRESQSGTLSDEIGALHYMARRCKQSSTKRWCPSRRPRLDAFANAFFGVYLYSCRPVRVSTPRTGRVCYGWVRSSGHVNSFTNAYF